MKLPNIVVRALAGAIFVALLVSGIVINQCLFAIIFSVITGLALFEFYTLMMQDEERTETSRILGVIAGVVLFVGAFAYVFYSIAVILAVYVLLILIISICELYQKRKNPIHSLAYIMFGQVYIAAPFALTNYLVQSSGDSSFQSIYLLAIFVLIWVNDTFAYLTGMMFGRHKLFERISPKKSWEGFVGGACFAIGASILFYNYGAHDLNLIGWIGFAIVTVAFGTWGDLIESLIKRTLQVKDSGKMIPGHGGILDRMDSTILAIPAIVAYICIFNFFMNL